jgi:hypothetical protein
MGWRGGLQKARWVGTGKEAHANVTIMIMQVSQRGV